jgi:uncharacterized protein YkwD
MHHPDSKAPHNAEMREAPGCTFDESGATLGGLGILLCILAATMLVLSYQSPGFSAQAKPPREKNNISEAAKKIPALEEAVLMFTNEERSRAGLPPFATSSALNYLARGQSRNMCGKRALQHESDSFPRGWTTFPERLKIVGLKSGGENVAYRTASPEVEQWAKQVVIGWMKSPPHKKNILTARFQYMGVGIAVCKDNLAYATQVFSPDAGRLP